MKFVLPKAILAFIGLTVIGLMFASQSLAVIDPETCVGAWLFEIIDGKQNPGFTW
jgi:hypothetical protein